MNKQIFKLMLVLLPFFTGCYIKKPSEKVKEAVIIPAINRCDTIGKHLNKYQQNYSIEFVNLDPTIQKSTTYFNNEEVYEFQFNANEIFEEYQISISGLRENNTVVPNRTYNFNISDNSMINIYGEKRGSIYIKSSDLAEQCNTKADLDCVYQSDWKFKIRGVVCGNYGPFSEPVYLKLRCH